MVLEQLVQLEKRVTQEQVDRYARVSGDINPLHVDPEYAATTQYGRTIAHGMLALASLSEMMVSAFGLDWVKSGVLRARFRAPVFPGDTVTTFGSLKSRQERADTILLEYTVGCRSQRGEEVVSGEARVEVPLRDA